MTNGSTYSLVEFCPNCGDRTMTHTPDDLVACYRAWEAKRGQCYWAFDPTWCARHKRRIAFCRTLGLPGVPP